MKLCVCFTISVREVNANPFFTQALARFFTLRWGIMLKRRRKKTFFADTLGHVYNKHLKSRINNHLKQGPSSFHLCTRHFGTGRNRLWGFQRRSKGCWKWSGSRYARCYDQSLTSLTVSYRLTLFLTHLSLDKNCQKVLTMEMSADSFFINRTNSHSASGMRERGFFFNH